MTQSIKSYNIANSSIKTVSFDSATSNSINIAAVAFASANAANALAQAANTLIASQTLQVANIAPTINVISITDSSYNVLDDTAANTTGGYLQVTGSNFQSGVILMVGTSNTALTTTLVNSTTLRAQIPAIAAGTYPVYVVNTNGGTAIKINALTTSAFPAWSTAATLTGQNTATAFAINLSASSDSNITYANTTVLPTGTTLLSNGYFYGTVTVGANTTYTFTVDATDVELQDATRTFSLTVTGAPKYKLWSWGDSAGGELGLSGATTSFQGSQSSPSLIGSDTNWSSITSGIQNVGAIKTNGTLWAWGGGFRGQLGTNDVTTNRSSPVQVGALTNWLKVEMGEFSTVALKTDGTLWTWGYNNHGQLGLGDIANRSSPVQVGSGTTWSLISNHGYVTIATKTDGTLWLWGMNSYGQLGFNDRVYRSSPTQVGTGTTWSGIDTSSAGWLATKTDGTLWSCGWNIYGQLGLGDKVNRSSPIQVGTATTWSRVSSGGYSATTAFATKTDGTLWAWGSNYFGDLGQNDRVYRSSPTQVGTGTTWSKISQSAGIKTDGTLWLWGYGTYGKTGQGDTIHRSSPVQVGTGTNWYNVRYGQSVIAITLDY